jgi:hypothetical protein
VDVAGHGVSAALIASMIKVAMQSVVTYAHEPREVLHGLNRILGRVSYALVQFLGCARITGKQEEIPR